MTTSIRGNLGNPNLFKLPAHLKDPKFEYYFADIKGRDMMVKLEQGWEVDKSSPLAKHLNETQKYAHQKDSSGSGGDAYIIRGELILMRIPKEKYAAIQADQQAYNDAVYQQVAQGSMSETEAAGAKVGSVSIKQEFPAASKQLNPVEDD